MGGEEGAEPERVYAAGLVVRTAVALGVLMMLARRAWRRTVLRRGAVGFFHPHTDGGGGGERVLWRAVCAVQTRTPWLRAVVYSGDGLSAAQLRQRAAERFGVDVPHPFDVVHLRWRGLVEPERYRHFTLLMQALGSVALGAEALWKCTPTVFVDTAGYAFTYPLACATGAKVVAYVHYPTISVDMLTRVLDRRPMYNNDPAVAGSVTRTAVKLVYYWAFALLYSFMGVHVTCALVNSSWTQGHIRTLWRRRPTVVYPPCDTSALQALPLARDADGPRRVISVAQFRPEKAHELQLDAWALMRRRAAELEDGDGRRALLGARLELVGGTRNARDEERVEALRKRAAALELGDSVTFHVNVPVAELRERLGHAHAGLHTMMDEHFGIGVVEFMAAGAVPIAHNSAGPKMDIVLPDADGGPTGFLAVTVEEYAAALGDVLTMPEERRAVVAARARRRAASFSDDSFKTAWLAATTQVFEPYRNG